MRLVMYRLVFMLDSAAVSTTRFISDAAPGTPTVSKTRTKGLFSGEISRHGVRAMSSAIAST